MFIHAPPKELQIRACAPGGGNLRIDPQPESRPFPTHLRPVSASYLCPDAAGPFRRLCTKAHPPGDGAGSGCHAFALPSTLLQAPVPGVCAVARALPRTQTPRSVALRPHQLLTLASLYFPSPRGCQSHAPILQRPLTSTACAPSLAPGPLPGHAPACPWALRQGDARQTPPPAPLQALGRDGACSRSPPTRPHFRGAKLAEPKSAAAMGLGSTRSEHVSGVSMAIGRRCPAALPALVRVGTNSRRGSGGRAARTVCARARFRRCPRRGDEAGPALSIRGPRPRGSRLCWSWSAPAEAGKAVGGPR